MISSHLHAVEIIPAEGAAWLGLESVPHGALLASTDDGRHVTFVGTDVSHVMGLAELSRDVLAGITIPADLYPQMILGWPSDWMAAAGIDDDPDDAA